MHEGILNIPNNVPYHEFGLSRVEMIECRRRVFWLGYLTEVSCVKAHLVLLLTTNNYLAGVQFRQP